MSCAGCAERDAEIRHLKRALAGRANVKSAADVKLEPVGFAGQREGHGPWCQCIGCLQGRAGRS